MRISDWSSTCALPICLGGCQCPELRIARIGDRRVILARRQNEGRVAKVEGAIEPQIERAGDAAFDLVGGLRLEGVDPRESLGGHVLQVETASGGEIGRASCRERVCQYV